MTITATDVAYGQGGTMKGRLFRDDTWDTPRPGVLVFPEGFGISEHTYAAASRVADFGYVALACDLYGEGYFFNGPSPVTQDKMAAILETPKGLLKIGREAMECLCGYHFVDKGRIAAIGYCIGATIAMELGFAGDPVAVIAGFHPSFKGMSLGDAGKLTGAMRLYIGAEDYASLPPARAELEAAFAGSGADWRMIIYGGVKHSFTNPACAGMGDAVAYDAAADSHSFGDMAALLAAVFAKA